MIVAALGGAFGLGPRAATWIYAATLAAGLVSVAAFKIDRDRGGYVDTFRTFYRPPYDKLQHFLAALALTCGAAGLLGVPAAPAAWGALAAGVGLEVVQAYGERGDWRGFGSWRDVVADALGAAIGYLILAATR